MDGAHRRAEIETPALSPSLIPSDIPDSTLPFGRPPVKLVEMETEVGSIPALLYRRIQALGKNANAVRFKNPMDGAICWHHAGRMLERKAGRVGEAWICYNRALALYPDHKPALGALRRLARKAGDDETLIRILEAQLDRPTPPIEAAALHTELAVIEQEKGNVGNALDALREAVRVYPETIAGHLLKIGVAVQEGDDEELADSLLAVNANWPESEISGKLNIILALIEERLGRIDLAIERLNLSAEHSTLTLPENWLRFRLALRLDQMEQASEICEELIVQIDEPLLRGSFRRIKNAIELIGGIYPPPRQCLI